jgi:hypothetical protein
MGFTYEWKLVGLKKQNSENINDAVIGTQWKLKATDEDGNEGTFTGATPFSISTINTSSFTPYSELTEAQVLSWIKNHVSGSNPSTNYMAHINGVIENEINTKKWVKLEVSEADLPWSPISGSVTPNIGETAPV